MHDVLNKEGVAVGDIIELNEFRVCWSDLVDNDEVASGEVAVLESEVNKFENVFRASGKFGGQVRARIRGASQRT